MYMSYHHVGSWEMLQYPFNRNSSGDFLCDLQDGSGYLELMKPGRFLSVPEHLGLMLNTDGVAVFKSSKHSLWPIYLCLTNLPPEMRMRKNNILLAGLWYGSVKPIMSIILKPVLESIAHLNLLGMQVKTSVGNKHVRARLLLSVFDLPAKALAVNMKQFNGKYGCLYCTHPGKSIRQGALIFPPDTYPTRTHADIQKWSKEAQQLGSAVFGIKGESPLASHIDLVNSIPIDYMHAVLEGVTKQFLTMWFNTKNHKSSFYLGRKVKEIDRLLIKIKPPSEFRRSPRSIETTLKFWKANEFRAWLLFYSLPVVWPYLPSEYFHHWSLLVFSIHILVSKNVPKKILSLVKDSLEHFYYLTPKLYGIEACTANLHSISHITYFVEVWGPLWTHSLFGYENMNGHIRKLFHGTRQVLDQLIFSVKADQSLFFKVQNLPKHEAAYFTQDYPANPCFTGMRFEGKNKKKKLPDNVHKKIEEYLGRRLANMHHISSRLRKGPVLLFSEYFCKKTRSHDSCVCSYENNHGEVCYARIFIIEISNKLAVATPYISSGPFLGSKVRVARETRLKELVQKLSQFQANHFLEVTLSPTDLVVIPLSSIIDSYVCINTNNSEYLISIPNHTEFH